VGSPHADKLHAALAAAMMSIPAAKGFEIGMGFEGCLHRGSEMIDEFYVDAATGDVRTRTNNSGGIQGGISNGMPITLRVAFKPVATLLRPVATITDSGDTTVLKARGRHDPCVLPRAVPVVEAMAALCIADAMI
jgi:chorismate synthase